MEREFVQNEKMAAVIRNVEKIIIGKRSAIELLLVAMLTGGHVLIEDVPGVGKTQMVSAVAHSCNGKFNRLQLTPDVMPSDITGFNMIHPATRETEFRPGAVFCNFLLADEINRSSPKTQSALLEVMEEGNVTVDGVTREVPKPFIVIATQNPIGSFGTQRLPEAQMDRFLICISIGYPTEEDEVLMLKSRHSGEPLDEVQPVISGEELMEMQETVENIFIHDSVYRYIVQLAARTREHTLLELGISPRGALAIGRMARAYAFLRGRDFISPKDVKSAFYDVGIHRVRLSQKARVEGRSALDVLEEILAQTKEPAPGEKVR